MRQTNNCNASLYITDTMEPESPVMLDSCADDCILIQTVKSMVTQNTHTDLESDEEFFLVSDDVQDEQQNVTEASNQEAMAFQSEERLPWSALCRVCANTSDHLIPIFDGEGLQHDLCNKLHKYLPIRVRIRITSRANWIRMSETLHSRRILDTGI